ncbi:MAG: glycosyltransferase, partial [Candidatus Portnoybacteria bacterium CG10_big_fil_rev_8_21_14_0_10_44_7]
AHFYPAKDLITLVRAAKIVVGSLPEARFVVVGDGREKARVTAEIKKLGLQKKVLLPGSIVPATPHIGAFDIFALSSRKEGSPWTILEAMAAGLPIVSTNVAGIPELIADQKNGFLVPPDRPDLLAEKIIYLLQRPAVAERFGAQNLTDIQKFTLPRMLAKFEKLYQ